MKTNQPQEKYLHLSDGAEIGLGLFGTISSIFPSAYIACKTFGPSIPIAATGIVIGIPIGAATTVYIGKQIKKFLYHSGFYDNYINQPANQTGSSETSYIHNKQDIRNHTERYQKHLGELEVLLEERI